MGNENELVPVTEEVILLTVKDRNSQYSIKEMNSLIENLNAIVVETLLIRKDSITASAYVGKGKEQELRLRIKELGTETVVINDNISPSQKKVLEGRLEVKILDRTEVIIAIFASRALTKEAKLQVEIAQLQYLLPRLTRLWTHLSRQQGGIGMRGVGEKQIEIDRRLASGRISKLKKELEKIKLYRSTQRKQRMQGGMPSFAIVGYTNAGKSSLFNDFKGKNVEAKDQLFATLDTITKKVWLNDGEFYLVDTVGFITNLPHFLVDSFKATLEEVLLCDYLIHVIDISNKQYIQQIKAVNEILAELGMQDKPIIEVYNKCDQLPKENLPDSIEKLNDQKNDQSVDNPTEQKNEIDDRLIVSIKTGENMDKLKVLIHEKMKEHKNES